MAAEVDWESWSSQSVNYSQLQRVSQRRELSAKALSEILVLAKRLALLTYYVPNKKIFGVNVLGHLVGFLIVYAPRWLIKILPLGKEAKALAKVLLALGIFYWKYG